MSNSHPSAHPGEQASPYSLARGRDLSPGARRAFDDILKKGVTGLAVLVAQGGREISCVSAGDVTPTSAIPIASASKWLVAATVMRLVDEGTLALDKPVSTWLQDLGSELGQVTLRQLLAQTSGVEYAQNAAMTADLTLAQAAKVVGLKPLTDRPGDTFVYGGPGFQVIGAVVEAATEATWEAVFQSRIGQPLGMRQTFWSHLDISGASPVLTASSRNPILQGGATSSVEDYARFLEMLTSGGQFRGTPILSADAVKQLRTDQTSTAKMTPTGAPILEDAHYSLGSWCETRDESGLCTLNSSLGLWGAYPWIDHHTGIFGMFFMHETNDAFRVWPELVTMRREILASCEQA